MEIIGLFCPALVSICIRYKRQKGTGWKLIRFFMEWGIWTLVNVLLTDIIITYILGIQDAMEEYLHSFSFFSKYVVIAVILAAVMPYLWEIVQKYISVTFTIGVNDENNENKICRENN